MVFDVHKINGIGEFIEKRDKDEDIFLVNDRAFLVINKNTIEVRTDAKLKKCLCEQYESVMESRYFGRAGIEIVMSGQLEDTEIEDLIRLSYNLTKEIED